MHQKEAHDVWHSGEKLSVLDHHSRKLYILKDIEYTNKCDTDVRTLISVQAGKHMVRREFAGKICEYAKCV
jgi:hypothetical protein